VASVSPPSTLTPPISPVTPRQKDDSVKRNQEVDETFGPVRKRLKINQENVDTTFQRLNTIEEHIKLLQYAMTTAKKSLLITSYEINHSIFLKADLYNLIRQARQRGVKFYIYYNNSKKIPENIKRFFQENEVRCAPRLIHSKILVIDKALVAIGSFNWLGSMDADRGSSICEGSIVYKGEKCDFIINNLWNHIDNYRNLQSNKISQVKAFENNEKNIIAQSYPIGRDSLLTYLTRLNSHRNHINSVFLKAEKRIIVCSPFISGKLSYIVDFNPFLLAKTINRNVEIFFVCSENNDYLNKFTDYLSNISSTHIHVIPLDGFHLKTVIVDDREITEGSFNWLSATRDPDSPYHNHESSFTVSGNAAKALIKHFYDSRVGQAVLSVEKNKHKTYDDIASTTSTTSTTPTEQPTSSTIPSLLNSAIILRTLFPSSDQASPREDRNSQSSDSESSSSPKFSFTAFLGTLFSSPHQASSGDDRSSQQSDSEQQFTAN